MRRSSLTRRHACFALVLFALADSPALAPQEAAQHVGEHAMVCGVVADASYRPGVRGEPTFLNFGGAYPNHAFTALIWGEHRARFSPAPETWEGARLCVTGRITTYRGKPQVLVDSPAQLAKASR